MAIATAIIGTITLAFMSFTLEPNQLKISQIDESKIGNFVKISGEVIKINKGQIISFDIQDETEKIRVISFDKINVTKGDFLEVIGKVDEYHGLMEINAEKIKTINEDDSSQISAS